MRPVSRIRTAALALLLTLTPLAGLHAQDTGAEEGGMCHAPEAGAPCDGSGPASQSASGGIDLGAGNPINVVNGNKYQIEVDLPALPGELGLEIVRHYNSATRHVLGQLGTGWRLSYETDLYRVGQSVQILQADGRRLTFAIDPENPNQCAGSDPSQGWVEILQGNTGRGGYIWHWTHGAQAGRQLHFDAQGKLVQIRAASGALLTLRRGARGELLQVTDPQGRSLMVNHGGPQSAQRARNAGHAAVFTGIHSMDSPVGRFEYRHGSTAQAEGEAAVGEAAVDVARAQAANLSEVRLPGADGRAIIRHYHYEDPRHRQALTGISVQGTGSDGVPIAERIATYAYDEQGKAVLSERGAQQVRLQYLAPALPTREGATLLINSLGEQTLYRHRIVGGEYRLTEALGAGCAQCGPVNRRWQYDEQGLLLGWQQLAATKVVDGQPAGEPPVLARHDIQRNAQGAIVQSDSGQARYDDPRWPDKPTRINRPSLVPGQQHRIELAYNEAGQVTKLTERGYSPINAEGEEAPTTIERTVRYGYSRINGRSVLTEVDGPLPNGPKQDPSDSDITRYAWDETGSFVTEVTRADGSAIELAYDAAGRVVLASRRDDYRQIDTHVEYAGLAPIALERARLTRTAQYLEHGQPRAASRQEQVVLQVRYDALGRRSVFIDSSGQLTQAEYQGANSVPAQLTWDDGGSESSPRQSDARPPSPATEELIRATTSAGLHETETSDVAIHRDAFSRPVAWTAGGETLLQAIWGEPGTATQSHILRLDNSNGGAQRRFDDFGRMVAVRSPGVQWQRADYDAADRITRIADARGAIQTARYDSAGRLLRVHSEVPGEPDSAETIELRWHGALQREASVTDVDGKRRNRFRYDALGRLQEEVQEITVTGYETVRFSVTHETDGSSERIRLADAAGVHSTLVQTRDAFGRIDAMRIAGALPDWISGGRTLIRSIDWTRVQGVPFARAITYGDGRTDSWSVEHQPSQPAPATTAFRNLFSTPSQHLIRPGQEHDDAGLPRSIGTEMGRLELKWDAGGRLKEIHQGDRSEHFIYDARGRRVAKRIGSAIRYFAWDGVQLAGEADERGRLQTRYAYLGWRPIAQIVRPTDRLERMMAWLRGPDSRLFATSRTGRVLAMYGRSGNLLWQDEANDPLRSVALTQPHVHQPLRDVGQYADDESGLIYHVARFFDPQAGLFLSPDPQGVADTLHDTDAELLLNPYAYAGGRLDLYFDPDGAAKVVYYAITNDASGKALGTEQGFTKARWAFTIEDIQPGGDPSSDLGEMRNQYAQEGTSLLYDMGGNFVPGFAVIDAIVSPDGAGLRWNSGSTDNVLAHFEDHYGDDLISVRQFTIDDVDDDNAARLLWYLSSTQADRKSCNKIAPGWLPDINFAAEETAIKVTSASNGNARKQRILACGDGSDNDPDQRRISKFEAAAEINETAQINRDCSADGCPGIGYHCDATQCYRPRDQLIYGPPSTQEPVYTPSYGRSQFIGSTLVAALIDGYSTFGEDDKLELNFTADIKERLDNAKTRAERIDDWQNKIKPRTTYVEANSAWSALSQGEKEKFTEETGLGEREYTDIARLKTQPPRNSKGQDLSGDAWAAFGTAAIFSDEVLKDYLLEIIKDFDKFTIMARALMQVNMHNALKSTAFDGTEEHLAAMVARAHNGGAWWRSLNELKNSDQNSYVKRFIGVPGSERDGAIGDWYSFRCVEYFGEQSVRKGTNGQGIGGLQINPLVLN